jgi:uncharacterized repeat protein (TIGR01451 family)
MKRKLIAFSTTMALLLSVFSAANVGAHTAYIESLDPGGPGGPNANRLEWFGLQSDGSGFGIVQRNAGQQGEFIFNDAGKDQRIITTTEPVTRETDLDWFGVTGDANALYFVAKVDSYPRITNDPSLELLITIDTTQNGSGIVDLPLVQSSGTYSTTQVASNAAWEFALRTTFPSGTQSAKVVNGTTFIHTTASGSGDPCPSPGTCSSQLASAVPQGNFAEVKVPWSQIGGMPTGGEFLRMTVSTLYDDHSVPEDGYGSPVIDVLGVGSTLADLQDGTIDTSFDVHFDTNGEPYAPLQVTEFQPNPIGSDSPNNPFPINPSTETEWIEIYNPNSFPISLIDYKISNTPKRNPASSQGAFKFSDNLATSRSSIAAGGVVIVAREKVRFVAGHPTVPADSVYDLSDTDDMTPYTVWAGGEIQLDNAPSTSVTSDGTFEEQVLLLDGKDGIVDMATYGNLASPYPGHTPISTAAVPEGVSYERCPAIRDTNNSATDFIAHGSLGEQTPGVACVGRPGIDMQIAKIGPSSFQPGDPVQFTISYANGGDTGELAPTVTITDTLPAGLTFTPSAGNAIPEPTTVNGNKLTWVVPAPLQGGALSTIILTTTSDVSLGVNVPVINSVEIASLNEQAIAKANLNTASWTTTTLGPADTSISSNFPSAVPPGGQFQFTITYRNTGQDDATDVKITDVLPAGVTILSAVSAGATWDNATTGTVTWDVGTLAPNASGTIVVTAQLASSVASGTTLSNVLNITVPLNDPTPADNAETKTVTVGQLKLYLPLILK